MDNYSYHKNEISFVRFSYMSQNVVLDPFIINTIHEFIFVKINKDPLKLNSGFSLWKTIT